MADYTKGWSADLDGHHEHSSASSSSSFGQSSKKGDKKSKKSKKKKTGSACAWKKWLCRILALIVIIGSIAIVVNNNMSGSSYDYGYGR